MRPKKAIVLAWTIEICAVILGLVNAYMTSLDRAELPFEKKLMIAAPFAMVAVAELSRIPLVQLSFYARNWVIRAACVIAVLATAGLTIENFAFGIERIVNLRLEDVVQAKGALNEAEENIRRMQVAHEQAALALRFKRDQLEVGRTGALAEKERLARERQEVEERRQTELQLHTERCKAAGHQCASAKFIDQINASATPKLARVNTLADQQDQRIRQIESELSEVARREAAAQAQLAEQLRGANEAVAGAADRLAKVSDNSQLHRMAASWFGVKTTDVSDEQIGQVRTFFSLFSASIISIMGTMLAIGYYAEGRWPRSHDPSAAVKTKLLRAIRAYVARRRKRVVRVEEKRVEVATIKEVEKLVEVVKERPVTIVKETVKWVPHPSMIADLAKEEKARATAMDNVVELAKKG